MTASRSGSSRWSTTPAGATPTTLPRRAGCWPKQGLVHVVGCYTSSSRKEVLPLFEKHDGLLWYPSHYEGFESSDNVVYTGAAPNQHIVPLAEHLLRHYGTSAYCLGSNYIWAWENNKIMREAVQSAGGAVLAERYVPVGETRLRRHHPADPRLPPKLHLQHPDRRFGLRLLPRHPPRRRRAGDRPAPHHAGGELQPRRARAGRDRRRGGRGTSELERLLRERRHAGEPGLRPGLPAGFPDAGPTSADAEASYLAVHLLARAVRRAGTAEMTAVRAALPQVALDAPQGQVRIDRDNRHCLSHAADRVSNDAVRLRRDLRGAGAGEAGPLPRLAGRAGGVAPAAPAEPSSGGPVMSRPIQNFRGRHALVIIRPTRTGWCSRARSPSSASA